MKKLFSILIIVVLISGVSINAAAATTTKSTTAKSTASTTAASSTSNTTSATTDNNSQKITVSTPKTFKAIEHFDHVELRWRKDSNVTGYLVSRSTDKQTWTRIAKIANYKTKVYKDYNASQDVLYYYSVKAYKKVGNKTYFSAASAKIPIFYGVNFYASTYTDSVMLNWSKVNDASGYEIYYSTDKTNFKRIKRINNNEQTSYTKTNIQPMKSKHYFYLKVFNTVNNKRKYLYQSDILCSDDLASYINGSVGKAKTYFKTWNVQGSKAYVAYKTTITTADKEIFNEFNKRFTADMSPYYRIYNTFMYIHKETTYASGSLYSKIGSCSYADAIFNKNLGQCAQYNGAMVEYLANLGFNVKLLMGYRGTSNNNRWQHFWGQVKLNNGKIYVVETGNYGNDGNWNYFFKPYSETKKYLKCGRYISGIK